jgi:hypothetical protein
MGQQVDAVLISYVLSNRVDFPTRIQNKSHTAIDNIFINTLHFSNFIITPLVHGLSDHEAQLLIINESLMINSLQEIMSPIMICSIYFSNYQSLVWFGTLF